MNKKEWEQFQADQQEFRVLDYFPIGEYNFTLDITSKQNIKKKFVENGIEKEKTYIKYNLINNENYDSVVFTGMMYRLFMEKCKDIVTIKSRYISVNLEVVPLIEKIQNITIKLDGLYQHPQLNSEKRHYSFCVSNVDVTGRNKGGKK